jgi:hypothetical protein
LLKTIVTVLTDYISLEILTNGRFSLIGSSNQTKHVTEEYHSILEEYIKEYYYSPKFFYDDYGHLWLLRGRYNMPKHID